MKRISSNSRPLGLVLGLVLCLGSVSFAETLTGTVTNRTTNKPSAGDEVILLKLAQGMQEAGRTKTDARGRFTFNLPDDGTQHLVRVNHDKVNYHQPAPQGTHEVQVDVYDAAPKVAGVSGAAFVYRLQTDAGQLQVTELIALKNDSNPPRSQMPPTGFEFYIPEDAVIDGTVAGGPGGMPVNVGAVPLEPKGHYGIIFPVRPGETRLQIAYHMPYSGSAAFTPRITMPTDNVGILIPKGMQIKSDVFKQGGEEGGALVYIVKDVKPEQPLGFTVSGNGQLPDSDASQENTGASSSAPSQGNRPGGGIGAPENGSTPLQNSTILWIIAIITLLLGAGAFFILKKSPDTSGSSETSGASNANGQIGVLKELLFRLETEKVQGLISEAEYAKTRAAIEVVLRWTLAKAPADKEVTIA